MTHQATQQRAVKRRGAFTERSAVLCAAIVFSIAGLAPADTVIDFNTLASPTWQTYSSHSEDGFRITFEKDGFTGDGFGVFGSTDPEFRDSPAMSILDGGNRVTLTREDGGTFDLKSIRLGEFRTYYGETSVAFASGDGLDLEGFTTDGVFGLEQFTFTGFTDLTSVSWSMVTATGGPGQVQFDDITVAVTPAPVPLPAAAWGGMALMGLIGARRFSRRSAGAVAEAARRA